ncbi:MAG: hypothetical protein A2660_00215 [Candidatus Doudnabacteria bacterium RIFCSPHIGHO2_01_FULL_45_18]|uniref:Peptidase M10 metallopeptidase domain-containing protein n=1 Tax=Candidatus Doudnabacteria bacterium RIFCSPHIGHO2_01_FULL_45_18 TaxID=1817823 RepID=A0A1F5NSI7_9BACT|nr:MAG: hypothetical protein A2660_00215 [Candidatus Doudnabacteria bacterium RIFCSPHIGHO2_01_FULL_45_18]
MIKKLSIFACLFSFLVAFPTLAQSTGRTLTLPEAAEHSAVIALGSAIDPKTGSVVEGFMFVDYQNENAKSGNARSNQPSGNSCYAFLAKGAKWKTVEPWLVNPTNSRGLDQTFVFNNTQTDIAKWNVSAGVTILGTGSSTSDTLAVDTTSPDGSNEVYFADVSTQGVIAVTTVWGIFSGPTFNRRLVEWDMVIDDTDFDWSSSGEAGKMDFENIITHELGHAAGMGHPSDSCPEETMFRFADNGETKKRTLNTGDIAGIQTLY